MNREELLQTIRVQRKFVAQSLGLDIGYSGQALDYVSVLLEACAYNTYIETVSNKTDNLYKLIKNNVTEATTCKMQVNEADKS